jgi:rubrerythrin
MDKKIMEQRLRQLMALDRNACDIYTKLAGLAQAQKMRDDLLAMAVDEKKHAKIEAEILSMILKD